MKGKDIIKINNQLYKIEQRPFAKKQAGIFLKEQREKKHLTVEQLAKKLDMNVEYVEMLERGRKRLSLDTCIKVCKVLNISITNFIDHMENVDKKILIQNKEK